MRTTVRFIGICLLFMLLFNISGHAVDLTEDSSSTYQFAECTCSSQVSFDQKRILDRSIWHTLSLSDVELGVKLVNEPQTSTNSPRNRRLLEQSVLFAGLHELSLRDGAFSSDGIMSPLSKVRVGQEGCDYYIFALRRILV